MKMYNLLNTACSASLVLLYKVSASNCFEECVVIGVALRVKIISNRKGLLNRSHTEIAHLGEFGSVLMHCVAEALVTSVHEWIIIHHVIFVHLRNLFQMILPSPQHLFRIRFRCAAVIRIRIRIFGSVGDAGGR